MIFSRYDRMLGLGTDPTVTVLPPGGARRLRSATLKMALLCLLPFAATAAIAVGGLGIDDSAVRAQQVAAGTLVATGAAALVIGILRVRSSVGDDVIHDLALRTAAKVLAAAAAFAWAGLSVLWLLALFAANGTDAVVNAATLSVPFGFTAGIATYVRLLPRRLVRR